jgi:hypothetical protein
MKTMGWEQNGSPRPYGTQKLHWHTPPDFIRGYFHVFPPGRGQIVSIQGINGGAFGERTVHSIPLTFPKILAATPSGKRILILGIDGRSGAVPSGIGAVGSLNPDTERL